MSIEKQQKIAKEVLEKLEILDPMCILAGGAPRNWYFGEEANDLDFYYYSTGYLTSSQVVSQFIKLGLVDSFEDVKVLGSGNVGEFREVYSTMDSLYKALEFKYKGMTVQIMAVTKPTTKILEEFSCDLCRMWWKGFEVRTTVGSRYAVENKTITFEKGYGEKDKCVVKMHKYYPSYDIILHDDLEVLEEYKGFV